MCLVCVYVYVCVYVCVCVCVCVWCVWSVRCIFDESIKLLLLQSQLNIYIHTNSL